MVVGPCRNLVATHPSADTALSPDILSQLVAMPLLILYDVAESERTVNVLVVGEKRGDRLYVLGKEYTAHDSDRPEGSESEP
jgi:hypothetical protein